MCLGVVRIEKAAFEDVRSLFVLSVFFHLPYLAWIVCFVDVLFDHFAFLLSLFVVVFVPFFYSDVFD